MRLWIDTDVGTDPDDAVALLCAAAHPDIEVVGVSTVGGDTAWRARVARDFVDAPVFDSGADHRLIQATQPDALLAIGPLTNVAALERAGFRAHRLAIMGGTRAPVDHRGVRMTVEHNFGADPSAAALVLAAGRVLLCPLDVTVRMGLNPAESAQLAAVDLRLAVQVDEWGRALGAPVCLHDPLALLALLGEPVVRVEKRRLTVSADGTLREEAGGTEHDVVVDVDEHAAKARIFDLLESGADRL